MRMWAVPTKILCQKHLCGEHLELHMFLSTLKAGKKVAGYLNNNCLEPKLLFKRHEDIKNEMLKRGYKHKSEITEKECSCICYLSEEQQNHKIDKKKSLEDLLSRCSKCKIRYLSNNITI